VKDKLLTLAIPTYNMEEYLEKCIRSCVCRNMEYLELIIVNDGSQDRSSEIGHLLEKEFPGIVRVIDKENGNYGTCVNSALAGAKGKYFKMLDPDDWADTKSLDVLLEHMKTVDVDMFYTVSEERRMGKELLCRMSVPDKVEVGKIYDARSFDGIALGAEYLYCSHCLTYRTEILRQIGLTLQAGISYTDNEFVFYPLDHIRTVVFYDLPLYQYFVGRPGATTVGWNYSKLSQMWQVLHGLFDYYYFHYRNTPEPVRNNQRIVIVEMVTWIFNPIFGNLITGRHTRSEQKEALIRIIQTFIKQDDVIQKRVASLYKQYRFDWYAHYLRTGKLLDHTPFIDWRITLSYMLWYAERILMILGIQFRHDQ